MNVSKVVSNDRQGDKCMNSQNEKDNANAFVLRDGKRIEINVPEWNTTCIIHEDLYKFN